VVPRRALAIAVTVFVLALAATQVVGVSTVVSASMAPRLEVGDRIVVNKLVPEVFALRRGDLAVFEDPGGWAAASARSRGAEIRRDTLIVKRVIGVGGDRVACCTPDGALLVNGRRLPEPYVRAPRAVPAAFDVLVPPGRYWVMGDNRARSFDSSSLGADGFVPASKVVGRVI
jgi:signal peptidase I